MHRRVPCLPVTQLCRLTAGSRIEEHETEQRRDGVPERILTQHNDVEGDISITSVIVYLFYLITDTNELILKRSTNRHPSSATHPFLPKKPIPSFRRSRR
jgi:hypothetical protein